MDKQTAMDVAAAIIALVGQRRSRAWPMYWDRLENAACELVLKGDTSTASDAWRQMHYNNIVCPLMEVGEAGSVFPSSSLEEVYGIADGTR